MSRNDDERVARARIAQYREEQEERRRSIALEQEAHRQEQQRIQQNKERLIPATKKALEQIEAFNFRGSEILSWTESVREGRFFKRWKKQTVELPGWKVYADNEHPPIGLKSQYYLLADGNYYIHKKMIDDSRSGAWETSGRLTPAQMAGYSPQKEIDAILRFLPNIGKRPDDGTQ